MTATKSLQNELLVKSHPSNFINDVFTQRQSSRRRRPDYTGKSCAASTPDEMGRSYKIVAGVAWSMKVEASGRSTPSLDL